jgi:hypothetical protein
MFLVVNEWPIPVAHRLLRQQRNCKVGGNLSSEDVISEAMGYTLDFHRDLRDVTLTQYYHSIAGANTTATTLSYMI